MKETLTHLHTLFQQTLRAHPETVAWNGENINNSGIFYQSAHDLFETLLQNGDNGAFIAKVKETTYASNLTPDTHIFIGAVYAGSAAHLMARGDAVAARRLAEEAVSYSQFDLFAQNTIIKANHAINPAARSLEETEEWLKTR
ncbi:MAG: hypothetical protein KGI37_11180, partial [Alphaproteobacteria bacterium]|nr:hypothetical protein [Alphaproteobacteria bacterium]